MNDVLKQGDVEISKKDENSTNSFERTWYNANFPPKESGRYWCIVEEQTDLGLSKFQWNCAWNIIDNRWTDSGKAVNVSYYTELLPFP